MILWIILTVMIALAAVGLTIPLVRRYEQRPQVKTVDILKGQLGEVDAQVAASLIDPAEAEALRSEIKRRILVEDRDAGTAARPFPQAAMSWVALGLVAIVTLCATALYAMMGHPELTSIAATTAAGVPQAQSAAVDPKSHPNGQVASMISSLEAKLQQKPGDAQGWQMLAWSYMRTGRPAEAAKAYAKAVAIDPKNVEYLAAQGEAMAQSEGKVSDDAAAIFQRALKGDPADPRARYFLAIHRDQTGDHKGAMDEFVALLKSAPPDAPWASQVRTYVEDLAKEQHVDLTGKLPSLLSAAASGPNSAQVAAAGKMSDADRQAMIHSMVDKLAGELKANPKDTGGWVRLMRARMVLGEGLQAAQDYKQARAAFAGDAAAQAALQEVAKSLGVPGA
ncbi:MAG: c-type cytochrome biogenesis protein CcmI [Alphaproteobacteria bacterium]|nr:c-type cytochrome biogenesis protein CcmI [Alphaproteobacteria bacterium]